MHTPLRLLTTGMMVTASSLRYVHKQLLSRVWYLRLFDRAVCVRLALKFTSTVMAPGEQAPFRKLYVMERGLVLYRGRVLTQGKVWGVDDVILTDSLLKYERLDRAQSMTYAETRDLSRDDLIEVVDSDPRSRKQLKKFAIYVATKRYMISVAKKMKDEEEARNGASAHSPRLLDRMDEGVMESTKQMKYFTPGGIGTEAPTAVPGSSGGGRYEGLKEVKEQLAEVTGKLDTLTEAFYSFANGQVSANLSSAVKPGKERKRSKVKKPSGDKAPTERQHRSSAVIVGAAWADALASAAERRSRASGGETDFQSRRL